MLENSFVGKSVWWLLCCKF